MARDEEEQEPVVVRDKRRFDPDTGERRPQDETGEEPQVAESMSGTLEGELPTDSGAAAAPEDGQVIAGESGDLQKQVDGMEAMIPNGGMPAARKPEPEPAPAPAETPAPAPVPPPATPVDLQARIEARKILADARLSAETAERRLREEAEAQRARMAEHAEALAAGVQLLRDRLARVDDRLNSASMDLENATGAIYQALDDTKRDLDALGADLRTFGRETAPAVPAQPPAPARQAEPPRAKATPRRVRPVRPERPQPSAPANDPAKRLRRTARSQRPVSQELGDALRRLDKPNK